MRATQTGQIQNYLLVAVATVLFLLIHISRAHAPYDELSTVASEHQGEI